MQVKNIVAAAALAIAGVGAVGSAQAALSTAQFNVTMTIQSACAVTTAPTDIALGSVAAQAAAIAQSASNTFKVNCSNKTPFNIGLAPSSANGGDSNGNGNMISTTAPTNGIRVPYTLYQSGAGGAITTTAWGNTATASSAGNGMSGTGAGMATSNAVSFTAWATAKNSDFAPDSYSDKVTVNVNY